MRTRGRKSAAALSVVTSLPGQRPEPPMELTQDQSAEWRAVVGRMPADWFTRENEALLIAYCRHVDRANVVAKTIDEFDPEWLKSVAGMCSYDKLLQIANREARGISALATRMRLTQQSRYKAERAATAADRAGGGPKPWTVSA